MRSFMRRLLVSGLLISTIILAACTSSATPTETTLTTAPGTGAQTAAPATPAATSAPAATAAPTTAATTAPAAGGGTLRWAVEGVNELPSLDPPNANAQQSVGVMSLVFEGLVRLDNNLKIAAADAESWDIKDGSKTFIFHLRKGLKFANGDPVTADDYAYTLNRAFGQDFANGPTSYYLGNIAGANDVTAGKAKTISGVKVIDPQTLEIDLETPAVYFLYQLTFPVSYVVPKQAITAAPQNWTDHAYGTGPFMVKQWNHNQSITLVPNPNYWAGQPKLAEIDLPFFQDSETAYKLYQTNGLDIMGTYDFPTAHIPDVQKLPDYHQVNLFQVAYIGFNDVTKPFSDVRVRQAFAQAVDKKTLVDKVLAGAVSEADTLIPPGMPGYNPQAKSQTFDKAAAQKLLAAAGYPGGKGFPQVALAINNENPNYSKIAAFLQQQWQENLGVQVGINTEELSKFNDDLTAMANNPNTPGAFTMFISYWGADYPDPQNFVSQQLHTNVGNNNGHYSNAQFDKLTDQADAEANATTRYQLYQQAEQIALTEVGWLPLYYPNAEILIRPTVKGLVATPQGIFPNPDWTAVTIGQ